MKQHGHAGNHEVDRSTRLSVVEQHLTQLEVKLKRVFGHNFEAFCEHEIRLVECSDDSEDQLDGATKIEARLIWVENQLERIFGSSYEALLARVFTHNQ